MNHAWADWPMPNHPGSQLPNEQKYALIGGVDGETVRDEITNLTWQRRAPDQRLTWQAARDYCAALSLGGWNDWRLPSRVELVSILDLSRTNPSINLEAFPDSRGEWYWTASPQADDSERAWVVYFYFGYPDTDPKENEYPARCVR
ncbi:MAG: DUF1566 domain-containing protein [Deltaproteobacteria bacterium]|nr:DUF1566 domain-containing protein [Deltaproteobacteria bacterium]